MANETRVRIARPSDIVNARHAGRALATQMGFSASELTLIATAISEVARNIVEYAKEGEIILESLHQNPKRGILITAKDAGPGIPDLELAMQDGYSSGKGLGLGLPGARRLMDEFELVSEVGKGTTVRMRKWVS